MESATAQLAPHSSCACAVDGDAHFVGTRDMFAAAAIFVKEKQKSPRTCQACCCRHGGAHNPMLRTTLRHWRMLASTLRGRHSMPKVSMMCCPHRRRRPQYSPSRTCGAEERSACASDDMSNAMSRLARTHKQKRDARLFVSPGLEVGRVRATAARGGRAASGAAIRLIFTHEIIEL